MGQYLTPLERTLLHIIRESLAVALIVALGALVTAMTHGATWQAAVIAFTASFATVILTAVGKYLEAHHQGAAASAVQQIESQLPVIPTAPQPAQPPMNTSPTQQPPPSMPVNQG